MKMVDVLNEMLKCSSFEEAAPLAIVFTHFDATTKKQQHFAVGMMERDPRITSLEVLHVQVDDPLQWLKEYAPISGLEDHRIARLLLIPPHMFTPILFAHYDSDNNDLIIDGRHRYYVACLRKAPYIPARIVPQMLWKQFLLEDAPEDTEENTLKKFSGIA